VVTAAEKDGIVPVRTSGTILRLEVGLRRKAVAAAVVCLISAPVYAQWTTYPTAGIPRTPDGRPNMNAPAPKDRDGRPDLSGLWGAEKTRPCPPNGCDDMQISEQFLDIGWHVPGGLPYQPWAAELADRRTRDVRKDDPQGQCLPTGIIRMHTTPLFRKIVQTPGLTLILNERNASYRQIFTDGRPLPVDPQPSWVGYSTGGWEGDVLVVRTSGFRDGLWLDARGSPLTEAGTITERFRRVDFGHLEISITVDDPKAYTKPWTTMLKQYLLPDSELIDYVCNENEKDTDHFLVK
jgi:hypothetical protein